MVRAEGWKMTGKCGTGGGVFIIATLLFCVVAAIYKFSTSLEDEVIQHLLLQQQGGQEKKTGCCLPCQIPEGECCLTCEEQSSDTEHEVLMALMEGLTVHIDTKHLEDHK
jgi:hypothetical protein